MRSIQELQAESLTICKMICSVCDKYQIPYFLAAGSLLGAVRHNGFIPWDDDIDIELSRKNFKKLRKLLKQEMGDKLIIQDYKTDKHFPFPFTKVFLKNEVTQELCYPQLNRSGYAFVDIFPLGRCPSGKRTAKFFFKMIELFTIAAKSKVAPDEQKCGYTKKGARLLFKLAHLLPVFLLQRLCTFTIAFFDTVSSDQYICYPGGKYGYPHEIYETKWYRENQKMTFEDTQFTVPSEWNRILTYKYGDYMKLPDTNARQGHFE